MKIIHDGRSYSGANANTYQVLEIATVITKITQSKPREQNRHESLLISEAIKKAGNKSQIYPEHKTENKKP